MKLGHFYFSVAFLGYTSSFALYLPPLGNSTTLPFTLPAPDDYLRMREVKKNLAGYLYGPSLMGNTSFFPSGELGNTLVKRDSEAWNADTEPISNAVARDTEKVTALLDAAGGINKLSDFELLYKDQWKEAVPDGVFPGVLSNFTDDRLFSMERLSNNPYPVRRLNPVDRSLPFSFVGAENITGLTLEELFEAGRLFYVDYRSQRQYEKTSRFMAFCEAYFYIHPLSGDFLPLAIKTNIGPDLIYTPLDTPDDWLLAKIMFNVNDILFAQFFHLAATHSVNEGIHLAALRTLSSNHPVLAILDRVNYLEYGIRPEGAMVITSANGIVSEYFSVTGPGSAVYTGDLYKSGAGWFQSMYLENDFKNRGLIDCDYGPEIKDFPFLVDAIPIRTAIRNFFITFVHSYYTSEADLLGDHELQNWINETSTGALMYDFPSGPVATTEVLVEILTQFTYSVLVIHHGLNTNSGSFSSLVLPLHSASLYAPPPTSKGVVDLMPFLPNTSMAIGQANSLAGFSRNIFKDTNKTAIHLWDDVTLLYRLNEQTKEAAKGFSSAMEKISNDIRRRSFDSEGLSLGIPFLWKTLDPGTIPFYFST